MFKRALLSVIVLIVILGCGGSGGFLSNLFAGTYTGSGLLGGLGGILGISQATIDPEGVLALVGRDEGTDTAIRLDGTVDQNGEFTGVLDKGGEMFDARGSFTDLGEEVDGSVEIFENGEWVPYADLTLTE